MNLLVVGYGKMGSLILNKWKESFNQIFIIDPCNGGTSNETKNLKNCIFISNINEIDSNFYPDVILFSVRPQDTDSVVNLYTKYKLNSIFISIIAAKNTEYFEKILGNDANILRIMPNICIETGDSCNLVCANNQKILQNLFIIKIIEKLGKIFLIDENLFNKYTIISGCMPGFLFKFLDLFVNNAVDFNLDKEISIDMIKNVLIGCANIIKNSNSSFDTLVSKVASKGGVTEAGLDVMSANEFDDLINQVFEKSINRSERL